MGAGIGNHQPHHHAAQRSDANPQDGAEEKGKRSGIGAAILLQHPGNRQPGNIGGKGDGEVETAGQNRQEHGKGQKPEFRQLESH